MAQQRDITRAWQVFSRFRSKVVREAIVGLIAWNLRVYEL